MYSREGTLVAQRFDWKSGRVSGDPVSVAERVRYFYSTAAAGFAARAGTIAYVSQPDASRLAWFDRGGREVARVGASGNYLDLFLTADGKRLLFDRARPGLETYHVWSYDLERGVEAPVTNGLDTEVYPKLLADGKSMIFSAVRGTPPLLRRRDMATGQETALTEGRRAFQMAAGRVAGRPNARLRRADRDRQFRHLDPRPGWIGQARSAAAVVVRQAQGPLFAGRPFHRLHQQRGGTARGLRHALPGPR